MSFIEKANKYEQSLNVESEKSFVLEDGKDFVMISAPHCVTQTRMGRLKQAEPQTGAIALLLREELNCPIIYKTSNIGDDANFDLISNYKNSLEAYIKEKRIKFLIDLHQLSPNRQIAIDIGTGKNKNLQDGKILDIFLEEFTNKSLGIIMIDNPFSGATDRTISSFIHTTCKIQCAQIEINSNLVYGEKSSITYEKVFNSLKTIVIKLNEYFGEKNEK